VGNEAVEVSDLWFRYLGGRSFVLKGISFSLEEGEWLLVLGPTGSGKSTLLLTLNGIIPCFIPGELEGEVRVFGLDPAKVGVAEMARVAAIVLQDPEAQVIAFTVEEEVAFALENLLVPRDEGLRRVAEALRAVGLEGLRREAVDTLSMGQKQRLALASALALRPRLLILDEPTAHLDPASALEFYKVLSRLRGETTVIVVEHRVDYVWEFVDKVLLIENGVAKYFGDPEGLFNRISLPYLLKTGIWIPEVLAGELVRREPGELGGPSPPSSPAIMAKQVSYRYPGGREALRQVSITAEEGRVTCILGPNGSGKTTLLKLLAGILKPDHGYVLIYGQQPRPEKVAYVMQNPEHMFVARSVLEDVALSLKSAGYGEGEARRRAYSLLKEYNLEEYADRSPFELSQGEKRLLSLLLMAALNRRVILMDEPTFGLDRRYAGIVARELMKLARAGRTVVVATHDTWLVSAISDKVVVLRKGRAVFEGGVVEFLSQPKLMTEASFSPPPLLEALVGELGDLEKALLTYKRYLLYPGGEGA